LTDIRPDNITPFPRPRRRSDPTAAERARRYRARKRDAALVTRRDDRRDGAISEPTTQRDAEPILHHAQLVQNQPLERNASIYQAALSAADMIRFIEITKRYVPPVTAEAVTQEPVTAEPVTLPNIRPDIQPDISNPEITPTPVALVRDRPVLADILAYAVAFGLAGIAGWFSLKGLRVLFPGAGYEIVVMGALMELGKIVACGWLAAAWRNVPWLFRGILMALIAGLAVINAAGLFSQLTAAHVGERALTTAATAMEDTEYDARIEAASGKLADLDRRLASLDSIVVGAAQRGRARTASTIQDEQKKARAGLASDRERAAQELADLKVQRAGIRERASIEESEAAPLRYAAELLGMGNDNERAIRLLILLMVLCCDPLASV
jgi:hypothetical protein